MRKRLSVGLALCLLLTSMAVRAVPKPTWDWTVIESIPKPSDPRKAFSEVDNQHRVRPIVDGTEFIRADMSFASFHSRQLSRYFEFLLAENNMWTDAQFAEDWAFQQKQHEKYLQFVLWLVASEYEYAAIEGPRSHITNVILVDDQGRRFVPAVRKSLEPKFDI
ncbi:MAG: hypothetical protein QME79_11310 [Bacillota bacterium]|nr:hypothetical protein [Bacillota bacterium]